nr:hypothetical protein [Tanacetum cinerariifolium]
MLVTVVTPLLGPSHHSIGHHSELVGHDYELLGAYSENSAENAYPNCEAVVCQQFENASALTMYDALARYILELLKWKRINRVHTLPGVLLHDPVNGDEEGTGVQTDALIKGYCMINDQVQIRTQSCNFA